ncbi:hypothetical protein [Streptomyces sp. 5-10]|uniref:hypothetical protein n=1 Tax=Streptomyces sp. 5-10 TaxID=878925 RepID=UPI00168BDFFC|nr:hypothetical protein [Streptomyces sp. 5-10]MBD3008524.1 hypothetical protein [Streptomyces sp. 5-10]
MLLFKAERRSTLLVVGAGPRHLGMPRTPARNVGPHSWSSAADRRTGQLVVCRHTTEHAAIAAG